MRARGCLKTRDMCHVAPFGAKEKVRNPRKITCESKKTRTKKRKKWKFLNKFVDSVGSGFWHFSGVSRYPADFWCVLRDAKSQGARGMPPDRADFGYLQNRRMSRGLACFRACGSMRNANSIVFLHGFATFRKARKGLV